MAGRPVDYQRRAQLLDAAVDYTTEQGLSDLSLRPIASALGVSTTTLVHHFGSKEQLLEAILGRLRERISTATDEIACQQPELATAARVAWTWSSAPAQWPTFQLFFAVYGSALQSPDLFADFLAQAGVDLRTSMFRVQGEHVDPVVAARRATLVVATIRGLLLDLLAGGDPERVHGAAEDFLTSLA